MRFVAQFNHASVSDLSVLQPACGLVRRQGEASPPSPCGLRALPPALPLVTRAHIACPQCWALPLCPAALVLRGCCDIPGRLREVRTVLAVCRRTTEVGALASYLAF